MKTVSIMTKSVKEFKTIIDTRLTKLKIKKNDVIILKGVNPDIANMVAKELDDRKMKNLVICLEDTSIETLSIQNLKDLLELCIKEAECKK